MTSRLVDAEPTRQHILRLQEAGFTSNRIAELAGLSSAWLVQNFLTAHYNRGRKRRTATDIAARIAAIDPEQNMPGMVDSTGTRRRVQALVAMGWPVAHIAARAGLSAQNMAVLLSRPMLRVSTVGAFADAYDTLRQARPARSGVTKQASARSRNRGRANRWPPPRYWDERPGAIDDPHFTPEYGMTRAELLTAEADWLAKAGVDRSTAAARLGVSRSYLDQAFIRSRLREAA